MAADKTVIARRDQIVIDQSNQAIAVPLGHFYPETLSVHAVFVLRKRDGDLDPATGMDPIQQFGCGNLERAGLETRKLLRVSELGTHHTDEPFAADGDRVETPAYEMRRSTIIAANRAAR